jgi:hypothetical protein
MESSIDYAAERTRLQELASLGAGLVATLDRAGRSMSTLLDGTGTVGWLGNDPFTGDTPSSIEEAAEWTALALDRAANRLLELHRVGDGPGQARYARACIAYASALRDAAAGRWPQGVEAIEVEVAVAIAEADRDARTTARGALRVLELDMADLRTVDHAGVRLEARVEFECRHPLTELRRLAGGEA